MSHLSMSQRAEPGPIYKVSWPEGSRLRVRHTTGDCCFHPNNVVSLTFSPTLQALVAFSGRVTFGATISLLLNILTSGLFRTQI